MNPFEKYLLVLIEKTRHVICDVLSGDVIFVNLGIVLFALCVITGKSLVAGN